MKKAIFAFGILVAMVMVSCQSSPESKLIGTWKVVDVETDFDADRSTPQMIKQVVDMQKQTFFKIINDSLMVIISTGNTYESKWRFNPEDQSISYTFDDWDENSVPFELGVFDGSQIISKSDMPMGKMVVHFEKE
jgi:hypothetical protein